MSHSYVLHPISLIATLVIGSVTFASAAWATEQAQQRRAGRDVRQETRQDARQTKQDCRATDQQSNANCRQDKRQTKQQGRETARDIKY
ncbi:hypothetical protein VSR17_12775 [Cupriavidus taiwanensis]|uniref:hypothetical protein n=1 Tax=Cupriavidus taiwanensis TaxID=164546 RepID=UPI000E11EABF|nr:hypothetical protein [Cupriavidus taiwanensis]SOY64681.1 conserved exported hypothetical protein [Cupriavidus taiwanensis]SOY64911.1 conserved exported hypothetical protein [Cupriavidus taiwanensis]SOY94077.1 conserved exported hypothetical protein [Cupriavidus taiwanensis]SOZ69272.1 conserved exported hypothetical protein [Cupriavidus taiwanensis]SOZ85717.1 conserved exported hypothetical protein [Cupriavidus taiwanensis]